MDIFNFLKKKTADIYTLSRSVLMDISYSKRTAGQFLNYNDTALYVNRAIDIRAEKVGEIIFKLQDKKGNDVERNEWIDLLNKPNEFQTGKQFWKLYQKYYDICGSVFIWKESQTELFSKNKAPKSLHLIRPDLVTINWNKENTEIESYTVNQGSSSGQKIQGNYKPEEIIYAYNPDPLNPLRGVSLLQAGVRSIETELQIEEYQNKILKNGGQIDGIFKFKTPMTKEQVEKQKELYKEQNAGAKNAGIPLFLGGDVDYTRLALNPNELSFLTTKGVTLDDICILTGVPRAILAVTSSETYANAEASNRIFLKDKIKPLLTELATILDWRMIPEQYDLTYVDPTPEDQEMKLKMLETADNIHAITINEKRVILGLEPRKEKEADELFMPFNLMPLVGSTETEEPVETPKEDDSESKKKSICEKGSKNPDCRQDKETKNKCIERKATELMEKGMSEEQASMVAKNVCSLSCEKKSKSYHPLRDKSFRRKYAELLKKRFTKKETLVFQTMKKYFKGQEERILANFPARKRVKSFLFDEVFDKQFEANLAKTMILPIIKQIALDSGIEAYKLSSDEPFTFTMTARLESWLDKRASLFSDEITETTYKKLKESFTESIDANEDRLQLIDRIKNVYDGFDEVRARTIARTETHHAVQEGSLDGYKQAGLQTKIWVWSGNTANLRESHMELDGVEVPIDQPFQTIYGDSLFYPGDGDASESINCACSI